MQNKGCGGTTLTGVSSYIRETAWSGSNGGFSRTFTRPVYQNIIHSNAFRGVPDVAANADPNTGYQVCFAKSCILVGGKPKRNFPIYDCIYV
jgi:kumamolisin